MVRLFGEIHHPFQKKATFKQFRNKENYFHVYLTLTFNSKRKDNL